MKSIRIKVVEDGKTTYDKETDWNTWMKIHKKCGGSPYCVQSDRRNYVDITIRGF